MNTCLSARRKESRRKEREYSGDELPFLPEPPGGDADPEAAALSAAAAGGASGRPRTRAHRAQGGAGPQAYGRALLRRDSPDPRRSRRDGQGLGLPRARGHARGPHRTEARRPRGQGDGEMMPAGRQALGNTGEGRGLRRGRARGRGGPRGRAAHVRTPRLQAPGGVLHQDARDARHSRQRARRGARVPQSATPSEGPTSPPSCATRRRLSGPSAAPTSTPSSIISGCGERDTEEHESASGYRLRHQVSGKPLADDAGSRVHDLFLRAAVQSRCMRNIAVRSQVREPLAKT